MPEGCIRVLQVEWDKMLFRCFFKIKSPQDGHNRRFPDCEYVDTTIRINPQIVDYERTIGFSDPKMLAFRYREVTPDKGLFL